MTEKHTGKAGEPIVEEAVSAQDLEAITERATSDAVLDEIHTTKIETHSEHESEVTKVLPVQDGATVKFASDDFPGSDVPLTLPGGEKTTRILPEPDFVSASASHPQTGHLNDHGNSFVDAPIEPEKRGNRVAGFLISILATIVFAAVYAGVLFVGFLFDYRPENILTGVFLDHVLSYGFLATVAGFFIGLLLIVLFVGRAGWWAYVLGGFWVAVIVWAAGVVGYGFSPKLTGIEFNLKTVRDIATLAQVIAAALVAREVTVWFGAWIGARGRKVKRQHKEAVAEYEAATAKLESNVF